MDRHGYCTRQARGRRFLLSKARTNSIKRTGLYMAMEECIFLPIQIIQETIKTGLKKPSKMIFIWSDF